MKRAAKDRHKKRQPTTTVLWQTFPRLEKMIVSSSSSSSWLFGRCRAAKRIKHIIYEVNCNISPSHSRAILFFGCSMVMVCSRCCCSLLFFCARAFARSRCVAVVIVAHFSFNFNSHELGLVSYHIQFHRRAWKFIRPSIVVGRPVSQSAVRS